MMRRWLAAVLMLACVGCGGEKEKDKYKDYDRPRPAEKK
jgi:hypothetical protein